MSHLGYQAPTSTYMKLFLHSLEVYIVGTKMKKYFSQEVCGILSREK